MAAKKKAELALAVNTSQKEYDRLLDRYERSLMLFDDKFISADELKQDDIVIIPAFGTDVVTRQRLEEKGCRFVDTTCGDVMSVWRRNAGPWLGHSETRHA